MTHDHTWRKPAEWDQGDLPNGFDRTLPPSDPRARSGVPASGYVVRDNRRRIFLTPNADGVDAQTPPEPVFGAVPVSGVVSRPAAQNGPAAHDGPAARNRAASRDLRDEIPVARITRDDDLLPHDLWLDPPVDPRRKPDPTIEVTPDFASEYLPPQPLPEPAQHKTFELKPVKLAPEIHPRTADTVLNARTVKRKHDKQQKDAREFEALLAQSERRRRGPLIAVAFVSVVLVGFVLGTELVNSPNASLQANAPVAEPPAVTTVGAPTEAQAETAHAPSPPDQRVAQAEPAPGPRAVLQPAHGPAASKSSPATRPAATRLERTAEPSKSSNGVRTPSAEEPQPSEPAPRPQREVWLK